MVNSQVRGEVVADIGKDREEFELPGLEAEFEVVRELGRGGTAVVYLALERALERPVAIKLVHPTLAVDEESVQRLVREARTLARLHHPNIVMLYGTRRLQDGRLALIMQYAGGETLRARLRAVGAFDVAGTTSILQQIAGALAHAHRQRVVHRDLKPENIYLDGASGRARLSDFGIARIWDPDAGLTLGGSAIGTPTYMSPEQIDGIGVDGRSDLYSLGLIGWELLTGRRPWDGENLYGIIYKQKHEVLPALEELCPGVPESLRSAIELALAKSPLQRWPDAETFLRRLDGAAAAAPGGPPARQPPSGSAPRLGGDAPPAPAPIPASPPKAEPVMADLPTIRFRRPDPAGGGGFGPGAEELEFPGARQGSRRRWHRRIVTLGIVVLGGILGAAGLSIRRDPEPIAGGRPEALEDGSGIRLRLGGGDSGMDLRQDPPQDLPQDLLTDPPAAPLAATVAAETPAEVPAAAPAVAPPALEAISRRPDLVARPTLVAGGSHTCFLTGSGRLTCWGANDQGQAGTGGALGLAVAPVAAPYTLVTVAAGTSHTCALTDDGAAICWGANGRGQLGTGLSTAWARPGRVVGEVSFIRIAAGLAHSCGLTYAGTAYCWGANGGGQLGDGTRSDRLVPTAVLDPAPFRILAAGQSHTCAVTHAGAAYCWGRNTHGQLGDDATTDRLAPTAVAGDLQVRALAAGGAHSCAITATGPAYCWGRNDAGQLGTGDLLARHRPAPVALDLPLTQLSAGDAHTCGLTTSGRAYCWGRNQHGQLGDGTTTDRLYPTPVADARAFASIRVNGSHTCASTQGGGIYCWGDNAVAQLGDGTRTSRPLPVAVRTPGG